MFEDFQKVIEDFHSLLNQMIQLDASDLFLTAGLEPSMKVHGEIRHVAEQRLSGKQVHQLAYNLMDRNQRDEFESTLECNFALAHEEEGRFRVNVFKQKNQMGVVLRRIKTIIPSLEELRIPDSVKDFALAKRGLVIMVGATGSGKSSTLAAMMGYRNTYGGGHIITVEDPIEFIHEHGKCIITQREVGVDTHSFQSALQNTLRQAPDVILIGEVRTRETMDHAIAFAETGHLCLTTMHANNANQALDRILNFFAKDRRDQILLDLSLNLRAIVAQQLIPTPDGTGRRVAVEILTNTPLVAQTIRAGDIAKLKEIMTKSNNLGMITFDQALYNLFKDGDITYEDALHHADSANEIRLMIKLDKGGLDDDSSLDGISLVHIDDV
ncbi:MAG: PilT/PilU family type 4a pilus ATPase [Thiohalomonadales bacterium]